jgi:phosphinothricin acetyltransferase
MIGDWRMTPREMIENPFRRRWAKMIESNHAAVVRLSRDTDVGRIADIYAYYVLHSPASFEVVPPDETEIARRRAMVRKCGLPHLVAEIDGAVVGYAYASPHRARAAYRYTLEDSVYVDRAHTRNGIGGLLLSEVIAASERAGYRQMVAVVGDSGNAASIGLHERLGFRRIGVMPAVGFKFGRWVDTVLLQRPLGAGDSSPAADT